MVTTAKSDAAAEPKESNGKASVATSFYEDDKNLKKLCDFLRSRHGPPVREALLLEKRVHYLKGKNINATMRFIFLLFQIVSFVIIYISHRTYL